MHGVMVQIGACGVLITGPAGSGKSQLGLELLSRGHRFVADDSVELQLDKGQLMAGGIDESSDFLALRCGVVVQVSRQFGARATLQRCPVHLVVSPGPALVPFAPPPEIRLLEQRLPHYFVQTLPGSAVCIEALAFAWQEQQSGYSAAEELAARQAQRMQPETDV